MKSSAFLLLLFFLTSGLYAAHKSTDSFVIIGDQTYFCDEVQIGKVNTSICVDGDKVLKVPTNFVKAYVQGSKLYEYLPVLTQDQDTAGWAFMQFLASSKGNRLYLYCSNCLKYDPVNGTIAPTTPVYRYYIFKSGKFVSVTDDINEEAVLASFGVKVIG
jgi:hypothetical protein